MFDLVKVLRLVGLVKRTAECCYQWQSFEQCLTTLKQMNGGNDQKEAALDARLIGCLFRTVRDAVAPSLGELREKVEQRMPKAKRRIRKTMGLYLKVLSLLGCLRVVRSARRNCKVSFRGPENAKRSIIRFLQNSKFTMKVDKKQLKERMEHKQMMQTIEEMVDQKVVEQSSAALLKTRTSSFDITAIDSLIEQNKMLVLPKTHFNME